MFEIIDEDEWLPGYAQGRGLKASKIRVHRKDGVREEHEIPAGPSRRITVTDERAIRHLEVDPRFTKISD